MLYYSCLLYRTIVYFILHMFIIKKLMSIFITHVFEKNSCLLIITYVYCRSHSCYFSLLVSVLGQWSILDYLHLLDYSSLI